MKKTIVTILLALFFSLSAHASEAFDQANKFYESGQYEQAIAQYETLLEDEPRTSVLNNLGSAYFHTGDMGKAILAFERGLALQPNDPELTANLKLAREEAAVYPDAKTATGFKSWLNSSRDTIASIVLTTSILLPVGALLLLVFRKRSPWLIPVAVLNIALLALLGWKSSGQESDPKKRGIVISKTAIVRLSPFEKAEDKGQLPAGREVALGELQRGYYWVSTPEMEGWLRESEVERVIP